MYINVNMNDTGELANPPCSSPKQWFLDKYTYLSPGMLGNHVGALLPEMLTYWLWLGQGSGGDGNLELCMFNMHQR